MEEEDWWGKLSRPFAGDSVRTRQGRSGEQWEYITIEDVVGRLNEVLQDGWSFEVVSIDEEEEEIVVLGKMTIGGSVRMQVGRKKRGYKTDGDPISLGEDKKSAISDCLKKCATVFGVGLSDGDEGESRSSNGGPERITESQLKMIDKKRVDLGMSGDAIDGIAKKLYKMSVRDLDKVQGADIVKVLNHLGNGGALEDFFVE